MNKMMVMTQFDMPPIGVGDAVVYYPHGDTESGDEVIAFVREVGDRTIAIQCIGHIGQDGVRHKNDPQLEQVEELREAGVWDYTDGYKAMLATIANFRQEIEQLREMVVTLTQSLDVLTKEPEKAGKKISQG